MQTINEASVDKPQKPGEKYPRSFRYLSFRKRNMSTTLASTRQAEKPLRRLSFKAIALSIQKLIIRVSVPKQLTTTTDFEKQETSLNDTTNDEEIRVNVVSPRPNWNSVFSGIQNHGNTCFLNAIIQCLSHTDLLAKFFVLDTYKEDLRCHKEVASLRKSDVSHGEVTERLAVLIKSLWTSRYCAEISSGFKTVVGKHGEQYRGTLQHDAQEFLLWLLDAVHEDINRSNKKKYVTNNVRGSIMLSDKTIDYSAILNYLSNNQSFILDVFQALLRSSLTCPRCGKQSITFDPYLSLSLPIPQRTSCPIWLTYIGSSSHKYNTRIAISIPFKSNTSDLLENVSLLMNVSVETLILTELHSDGFRRTFTGNCLVPDIQNVQNLHVFELSGYNHFEKPTLLMQTLFPRLPTVAILVINCEIQNNGQLKRFGAPFSVRVLKELNYICLQEAIFKASPNIKCNVQPDGNMFGLRVCISDRSGNSGYLTPEVDHPLYQNVIEESLKDVKAGPPHVKMIAEWSKDARQRYFNFDPNEKLYNIHSSVAEIEKLYAEPWIVSIDECLRLYTQEEELSDGDAWLCPNCKHEQQGAKKQLHLHTVPDVLIIHLKRFKQLKSGRSKLHIMVDFPVEGLDMSPYMDMKRHFTDDPPAIADSRSRDFIYDLYAVCNHLGSMCVGHYIAACKNPVDGNWYNYDDFRVARIPKKDIVTKSAYLLFYVRRSSDARTSLMFPGSLVSPEHWVFNAPKLSLASSQDPVNDSEGDNKVVKKGSTSPSLAEYDVHYTTIPDPPYYRVMSESCV